MVKWNFEDFTDTQVFQARVVEASFPHVRTAEEQERMDEKKGQDPDGDYAWMDIPQMHIGIKPLDHEVKGKTGMYHEYFRDSNAKKSPIAEFVRRANKLGIVPETNGKFDASKFIGMEAYFREEDMIFSDTMVKEGVRLPFESMDGKIDLTEGAIVECVPSSESKSRKGSGSFLEDFPDEGGEGGEEVDWTAFDGKLREDGMSEGQMTKYCNRLNITKKASDIHVAALKKEGNLTDVKGIWYLK